MKKHNMKKHNIKRNILMGITCFSLFSFIGCGYTDEEKQEMKEYAEQGKSNALNYIKEKYGFDATVTEVKNDKFTSFLPELSPDPTGDVFVTMEYNEKSFMVFVSGEEETTEGLDNYQLEEISSALQEKLYDITGLPIEELFVCYGEFETMKNNLNGMINTYFDGENLSEIMEEEAEAAAVSYINQDVSAIDMDVVAEQTGILEYLFVDYTNKEQYASIKSPYYNIAGSPIDSDVEDNMHCINGYRVTSVIEDAYVEYKKTIIDDIILITENPEAEVSIEKTTIDDASQWNGKGFINAKQIFDAYALHTDASKVYVFIPMDKFYTEGMKQVSMVKQFSNDGNVVYKNVLGGLTDDEKYLHGVIYTEDYTDIKISVFMNED